VSKAALRVDWCTHEAARYAVEHWHYSGSLPPPPHNMVGAWEDGKYIGVIIFSRGAAMNLLKPYGLETTEGCELVRVALRDHKTTVSRIVSIAMKFLKQRSLGMRLIVSFADPSEGHHGGIYQAGNWIYAGETNPTSEYIGPDGKVWHERMISPTGKKKVYGQYRAVWKPEQCKRIEKPGKHRYLYPLDDAMRAQIAPLAKPYPKRAPSTCAGKSSPVDTIGGEGGASPTSALQGGGT
jgi:hypothetical protein